MAKITGITNLSGTIDGLVYYMLNGQQMVRKAPGKRRGPKTEGMKNAQKSSSEFGKAAKAGKHLRTALALECLQVKNRHLSQQVTKLMIQLKTLHERPLGKRTATGGLLTAEGRQLLADFTFHTHTGKFPRIVSAVSRGSEIQLDRTACRKNACMIVLLQINFETGDFTRREYPLPLESGKKSIMIKKKVHPKKGCMDLVFISGGDFLQGVVLETED